MRICRCPIKKNEITYEDLTRMQKAISHRGTDGHGIWRLECQKKYSAIIEYTKNLVGIGLQFELIIVDYFILRNDLQEQ